MQMDDTFCNHKVQKLSALIISENTFLRGGIRALLWGSRYQVDQEVQTIAEATSLSRRNAALILVGGNLTDDIIEPLKSLRVAYPQSRILFYAQTLRLPGGLLLHAFGGYLNGCLTADMSAPVLRRYIDLTMMGQTVFRPSLLAGALPPNDHDGSVEEESGVRPHFGLSDREHRILESLNKGWPNKAIARELRISEATVKTHIRTLLRKIGAANRTQAAIWAAKNHVNRSGERRLPETMAQPRALVA